MNKLSLLKTSFCALLGLGVCAAGSGYFTANADDETVYPESFVKYVRDDLQSPVDYAVGGGDYAFADGTKIKIYGEVFDAQQELTALDYFEGSFYYQAGSDWFKLERDEDGNFFGEKSDYKYTQQSTVVLEDGSLYRLIDGDLCYYAVGNPNPEVVEGSDSEFFRLKIYDNTVYALSGRALYQIDAATAKNVSDSLTYIKFDTERISIGNSVSILKNYNLERLHFVTLKEGYYITKVNLDDLDGKYFITESTCKIGEKDAPEAETTALLLCTSGNAAIVMIDRVTYILLSEGVGALEDEPLTSCPFNSATVSINDFAYSSPHRCEGTKVFELIAGNKVKILGKVSTLDFYKIEYENADGEVLTGYVPLSYISQFTYIESDPNVTQDPEFDNSNLTQTIVIVLVVVLLILIAVGYLIYTLTSGKSNKRKISEAAPDNDESK